MIDLTHPDTHHRAPDWGGRSRTISRSREPATRREVLGDARGGLYYFRACEESVFADLAFAVG
jgi:hypothetical protein